MTKQEEKQRLRQTMGALEASLPPRYRTESEAAIVRYLLTAEAYREARTVFCFVGTAREIDTRPFLEVALTAGKRLCVPRCLGKGVMEAREIVSLTQLRPGMLGLLEPGEDCPVVSCDAIDLAVLPCVTCSLTGQRLGRGGGYYDRFLAAYRGAAVLLCRERLLRQEIPVEPHDCPIPWVLTERGLYEDGTPARFM